MAGSVLYLGLTDRMVSCDCLDDWHACLTLFTCNLVFHALLFWFPVGVRLSFSTKYSVFFFPIKTFQRIRILHLILTHINVSQTVNAQEVSQSVCTSKVLPPLLR